MRLTRNAAKVKKEERMNEFKTEQREKPMTHDEVVLGIMGISLNDLVNAIRENRDGVFDCLYKQPKQEGGKQNEAVLSAL